MILRSNPDGSDFEVYAQGLRNTHEFVFDNYGNLISSDNDGDHRGESERLVHVVEGADAGWRSNWQYGKYTDPKIIGIMCGWMKNVGTPMGGTSCLHYTTYTKLSQWANGYGF